MRHYEGQAHVDAPPEAVFAYVDDHEQFGSHMNQSSGMLGGGSMTTELDEQRGRAVGSHIRMTGKAMGFRVSLDEVVTSREPPHLKAWETTGNVRLLVVGDYRMRVLVDGEGTGSRLTVAIDYELPARHRWLGRLFGRIYARWCVRQMLDGAQSHFSSRVAAVTAA